MDPVALSANAQKLFDVLPPSGRIRNSTAVKISGLAVEDLNTAKAELKSRKLIEVRPGWGGPFGRITSSGNAAAQPNAHVAVEEKELYVPFQNYAKKEFLPDDYQPGRDYFSSEITANKRPSDYGQWEAPDLLTISLMNFPFVPYPQLEVISFEIKPLQNAFKPDSIFETISHSKFCHKSYYCFECPDEKYSERTDYDRILVEAISHKIGLIRMFFLEAEKKSIGAEIILDAHRREPDPFLINDFIENFFPEQTQNEISTRLR